MTPKPASSQFPLDYQTTNPSDALDGFADQVIVEIDMAGRAVMTVVVTDALPRRPREEIVSQSTWVWANAVILRLRLRSHFLNADDLRVKDVRWSGVASAAPKTAHQHSRHLEADGRLSRAVNSQLTRVARSHCRFTE